MVKTELTVAVSLFSVRLAHGQAARSLPRHCEHLQPDHGIPPMPPMSLIVSLGRSNAESEALRGHGNGAAAGPSSRRAPHLLFLPYRVRLIALVTLVVFFLFGVVGNATPTSSEEVTSSAAMALSRSAPAPGSSPPLLSPRAVRSDFNGSDYIPHRGNVTSPPWTMGAVHVRSVSRSTRPMVERANPSVPRGPPVGQRRGQPRIAGGFAL